jgi:probable phosphoglycerate mutase
VSQPSLFGEPGGGSQSHTSTAGRAAPLACRLRVGIEREDGTIVELKESLALATNNVAEYRGLLAALMWAAQHGINRLHVRSDSLLLVKQMCGDYRVKHPGLQPLWAEARGLARQIGKVQFEHVRRELNKDADRLANEAMDEAAASRT